MVDPVPSRVQLDELLPEVYDELRRFASLALDNERNSHSFQTTELTHEAFLRLARIEHIEWENKDHLMRAAVGVMRRVLIDCARSRQTLKRNAARVQLQAPRDQFSATVEPEPELDLLALDDALSRLEQFDRRKAEVIELRYFGGQSVDDTARILNVSPATVKRDWTLARAWLKREMNTSPGP